jgi:DNA-binding IclR family transcriptional regulator
VPADASDDRRSGSQAVERAVRVLRVFEREGPELGVSQIATAVGLPVSTVHRMVRALVAADLLAQDAGSERYHLGSSIAVLGQLAAQRLGYEAARPTLERLAADTGESVNLGVLAGSEVLVVVRVSSRQSLRFDQAPGTRVPAHASAMGKVLLAGQDERQTATDAASLRRLTSHTITSPRALAAELRRVHEQGWALNDEERHEGVRAVAAPVLDRAGRAVAAVAIQGPSVRLSEDRVATLAEQAQTAAFEIAPLIASR